MACDPFTSEAKVSMLGLVLLVKGLTIVAPIGLILFQFCETANSDSSAHYWRHKVADWERQRQLDDLQRQNW